jgi:hypothetical protein
MLTSQPVWAEHVHEVAYPQARARSSLDHETSVHVALDSACPGTDGHLAALRWREGVPIIDTISPSCGW